MRHIIFILSISLFVISCGQSDTKQKELELKEKELALKQQELELKEKELKTDSGSSSTPKTNKENSNTISSGTYSVKSDKSYFYNSADPNTIRKGYMVKGDIIDIQKIDGDYAYGIYTSTSGSQITGWVLSTGLEKSSNTNKPMQNDAGDRGKFIGTFTWSGECPNGCFYNHVFNQNGTVKTTFETARSSETYNENWSVDENAKVIKIGKEKWYYKFVNGKIKLTSVQYPLDTHELAREK